MNSHSCLSLCDVCTCRFERITVIHNRSQRVRHDARHLAKVHWNTKGSTKTQPLKKANKQSLCRVQVLTASGSETSRSCFEFCIALLGPISNFSGICYIQLSLTGLSSSSQLNHQSGRKRKSEVGQTFNTSS